MAGGYDLVISTPSSTGTRRVTYRESSTYGGSWEVNVYTRRSSQRVIYSRDYGDYELYSPSYRRRVYYY